MLQLILGSVWSAECKYATFPTEGSVALLNNTDSGCVPRIGKLSSAKSGKDTRKQFLSFNSAFVALTTDAPPPPFFWWKLLKKKNQKTFSFHVSLTSTEEMEKIKAECVELMLGILTKVLERFAHCCTSPSWSFNVHFQPWDKGRVHGWTGSIYAGIPFVHFSEHFGLFPWQSSFV